MNFDEAKTTAMGFGKHKGQRLMDIAGTNHGLLYLDYMAGEVKVEPEATALRVYVTDPTIADEIERAMEAKRS